MDITHVPTVNSPLMLFALIILVCNAVFAVCATKFRNEEMFIYTIHMFLGIVFFVGSIILWSPGDLYNPVEVKELKLLRQPWVPTIATFLGVLIYMAYHVWFKREPQKQESTKPEDQKK